MNNKIKNLKRIECKLQKSYSDLKLLKSLDTFVSKKNNINNESQVYDNLTKDIKEIQHLINFFKD